MTKPVDTHTRPKLRAIDLQSQLHNGETYILLQDPMELSEQSLLLPCAIAPLLAFLDGNRTIDEVATAFGDQMGVQIETGMVCEVVEALDTCFLLENSRAQTAAKSAASEFRRASARPMLIAGDGYPKSASELQEFLDAYMPGTSPSANGRQVHYTGLLSPHIDYGRGGSTYGEIWSTAAASARQADAVVIFATDHYGFDPFTLTRQSYATPYGLLPTDSELNDALADALGEDAAFAGELRHRREHSVELVAVWLHHIRNGKACPIVPILCGGLHDYILQGRSPMEHPQVTAVLDTLQSRMQSRRILIVASGDLAHVGPAFRGSPLNQAGRQAVRTADEELLACMEQGDAEAFFRAVSAVQDCNNVCGVMPIYLTMKLLERTHGSLRGHAMGYMTCPADAANTSAVTVAGVAFE